MGQINQEAESKEIEINPTQTLYGGFFHIRDILKKTNNTDIYKMQEGDVLLYQTPDGGNINVEDGIVQMTQGLETAVYLSLFSPDDWYGNDTTDNESEKLHSETELIISKKPQTSKNYQLLVQAIESDLKWLTESLANNVTASVSSDTLNRVNIDVTIEQDSGSTNLTYTVPWGSNG